ncbi:Gibberellin 2-beta-dioxygenase 4 [Glycine soja]|uniref:Gibberellin 2-beta-dioxygenase 4 n=1 Tax=Glycine soja TaxID=3848 RepID=A0A445GXR4_GLYSO|nr:Gibberellin 2-beta-dioxygenase 4 [Glycine soja]
MDVRQGLCVCVCLSLGFVCVCTEGDEGVCRVCGNDSSSVTAYTEGVRELACEILELMAEGLGVPDTWFFSRLIREVDSDSVLRFNHYPPIILNKDCFKDNHNHTKVIGFREDSDPQILTILRSNDVAGLQISLQDGMWNPVAPDPLAFCVNVGDLLQGREGGGLGMRLLGFRLGLITPHTHIY